MQLIIFTIIGLIADIITIISMKLFVKHEQGIEDYNLLDFILSTWNLIFIWVISFIVYLWLVKISRDRDSNGTLLLEYLVLDVIIFFQNPLLLIIFLTLVWMLFVILGWAAIIPTLLFIFISSIVIYSVNDR